MLKCVIVSFQAYINVFYASQPYSTTGNVIILYVLIFKSLERSIEDKREFSALSLHFISSCIEILSVNKERKCFQIIKIYQSYI